MTSVTIHGPTGVLLVDGQKVFPIGLSDPPPHERGRRAASTRSRSSPNARRHDDPHGHARLGARAASTIRSRPRTAAPGRGRGARPALLAVARRGPEPAAERPPTRSCCRRSSTAFKDHPALVRLQGRRRAAQPVPRRELDPPGRARARAHEQLKALDPDAPARDHPGAAQHGRAADRRTAPRSTSPAPTSTRSRIRPACTRDLDEPRHQRRRRRDRQDGAGRAAASRSG